MSRSQQPRSASNRWNAEHRGGQRKNRPSVDKWKKAHSWLLPALIHAWALNRSRGLRYNVYACRWGSDYKLGETARKHWHVGRKPAGR